MSHPVDKWKHMTYTALANGVAAVCHPGVSYSQLFHADHIQMRFQRRMMEDVAKQVEAYKQALARAKLQERHSRGAVPEAFFTSEADARTQALTADLLDEIRGEKGENPHLPLRFFPRTVRDDVLAFEEMETQTRQQIVETFGLPKALVHAGPMRPQHLPT